MKTSIIVSSFAALCLLISFAEAPTRFSTDYYNGVSDNSFSFIHTNNISIVPARKISADKLKTVSSKSKELAVDNFSYLKFEVDNYSATDANREDEIVAVDATLENTLDYLKFDVDNFVKDNETSEAEIAELPLNEFSYLKFNVDNYINAEEANTAEITELPVDEFSYLKFDADNFINADAVNAAEITELPVDEFSYLKFDVDTYINAEVTNTTGITELPVDEFSYIKFDVSKYSAGTASSAGISELPATE